MAEGRTAFLLLASAALAHSLYLAGEDLRERQDRPVSEPRKRPFCNAFTGCGRKRSQLPPLAGADIPDNSVDVEESLGTLLDLSAEPAVENLSRQIMSEAKLWEAIQEANMEIMRQRQAQQLATQQDNLPDNGHQGRGHQLKCALPSCIAI